MPQISVIVPIYNVEYYLESCIISIINQTFTDIEIILIDDGSTDNSGRICDYFANKDSRIITIHKFNEGLSEARNTGIKIAKGEYIAFVDGDDYIHPQMLEIQHYHLSQNKDLSFSIVKEKTVNHYTQVSHSDINNVSTYTFTKNDLFECLYKNQTKLSPFLANVVHCKLYKSSIIKKIFFRNFIIGEDTEYNSRLYQLCTKAIFINYPLYYYIQRDSSLSHQVLTSINHINRINMYYTCLCNTPSNNIFYRSLILERMYKFMFNIRYHNRYNQQNLKIINTIIYKIRKKTIPEFLSNTYISVFTKIVFLIIIKFPFIYTFFILLSEQIKKFK